MHTGEILVIEEVRLAVKQQHWDSPERALLYLEVHRQTLGRERCGVTQVKSRGCFKVRYLAEDHSPGMTPSSTVTI